MFLANLIPQGIRGYLEYLRPLYIDAKPSSPLFSATTAAALAVFSSKPGRKPLLNDARIMYGKAVQLMKEAIADPVEVGSDLTLMSVMLCGLFETITGDESSLPSFGQHTDGAVALVKLRGREMLNSPISKKLFSAVRAQMVITQTIRCQSIVPLGDSIDNWQIPRTNYWESVANNLTTKTMQVPSLRASAARLLRGPMTMQLARDILDLIKEAKRIDGEIAAWSLDAPELLRYKIIGTSEEMGYVGYSERGTSEIYPGPVHAYSDLMIAVNWNSYRSSRVFCQTIILNCIERLVPPWERTITVDYRTTTRILQNLADEICASVPYHLGYPQAVYDYQNLMSSYRNQDNYSRDDSDRPRYTADPRAHTNNATAIGGYLLVWHLYVASSVVTIPDSQRRWITNRLIHIGERYGLSQAKVLASLGTKSSSSGRNGSITDFAPPRDLKWERTGGQHWRELLGYANDSSSESDGDGLYED